MFIFFVFTYVYIYMICISQSNLDSNLSHGSKLLAGWKMGARYCWRCMDPIENGDIPAYVSLPEGT